MFDRTVLVLGAFKLEAVVMAPGETCVEALGDRAIAVMLVSGQARCNGVALERWRQVPVARSCCLEALEGCVVARLAIDGKEAVHLGRTP
jgi:hypothetical protein